MVEEMDILDTLRSGMLVTLRGHRRRNRHPECVERRRKGSSRVRSKNGPRRPSQGRDAAGNLVPGERALLSSHRKREHFATQPYGMVQKTDSQVAARCKWRMMLLPVLVVCPLHLDIEPDRRIRGARPP